MFDEMSTKESVETLEQEINKLIDSSDDKNEVVSRIMFKVLTFTLQNMDNNLLHNYSWKYFNDNKEYFMNIIP
jgi:ubiquinone biosynthesis protein UbiJ